MADVFSKSKRSEVMSRIRSRGNKDTEVALARLLRVNRISGWRRHLLIRATVDSSKLRVERRRRRKLIGKELMVDRQKRRGPTYQLSTKNHQLTKLAVRPDFVFRQVRLALFVDGCFWHGCPKHATQPKGNRTFWKNKFAGNKARDILVTRTLRSAKWRVLRIWEHELARKNEIRLLQRIQRALG